MADTTAYPTAKENMDADRSALSRGTPYVKLIVWPQPSVTYPHTRPPGPLPPGLDASSRPTGGGLLLHSPGSLVLTIVVPTHGVSLGRRCRPLLAWVQQWCGQVLASVGIATHAGTDQRGNVAYCGTYHNPYELIWQHEKVVALALKQERVATLIQGMIHIESNDPYFALYFPPDAMTKGLSLTGVAASTMTRAFVSHVDALTDAVERWSNDEGLMGRW